MVNVVKNLIPNVKKCMLYTILNEITISFENEQIHFFYKDNDLKKHLLKSSDSFKLSFNLLFNLLCILR